MIKLIPNPTFKARVPFTVPGADEPAVIEIEFAHRAPAALAAWWSASQELPAARAFADIVLSWSGVIDESGAEVACTPETLAQFLAGSATRGQELLRAYLRELTESRLKN
jgi:hypothetical protein